MCHYSKRNFELLGLLVNLVGIELISPILRFNEPRFRDLVRGVWGCLSDLSKIYDREASGTESGKRKDGG